VKIYLACTVRGDRAAVAALREAGVDLDDVVEVLEQEGVEKFVDAWEQLLTAVQDALAEAAG
jgi:transaldolase